MTKERRIRIRGKQREQIDADLMAQLVVLMGRQLAAEAVENEHGDNERPSADDDLSDGSC